MYDYEHHVIIMMLASSKHKKDLEDMGGQLADKERINNLNFVAAVGTFIFTINDF